MPVYPRRAHGSSSRLVGPHAGKYRVGFPQNKSSRKKLRVRRESDALVHRVENPTQGYGSGRDKWKERKKIHADHDDQNTKIWGRD